MKKYYTRACNFTHGKKSVNLVKKKINLPLRGNNKISFNEIEIISRNYLNFIKGNFIISS